MPVFINVRRALSLQADFTCWRNAAPDFFSALINAPRAQSAFLSASAPPRCEEGTTKSSPAVSVCAQEKGSKRRLRLSLLCIFPPDRSGYRTAPAVKEVLCWACFAAPLVRRRRAQSGFTACLVLLRSLLTCKWDAGYAASPASLE